MASFPENDNVYPGSSRYFRPDVRPQKDLEKEEKDKTLQQVPALREELEYIEARIAYYASVDSIQIDLAQDLETHRNQVAINKLMKAEWTQEKARLERKIKALER